MRCPRALARSLELLQRTTVDLYIHHYPSRWVSIPRLMNLMADAVEHGEVRAVGVSNYSADQMRLAHAVLAERGIPLASNQVEHPPPRSPARDRWRPRRLPSAGGHPHRQPAPGQRRPDR